MKRLLLILCLSHSFVWLWSQKPIFHGKFDYFSDNREYFSKYGYHHTMIGSRLDLNAQFIMDSTQHVVVGINYLYEYGHDVDAHKPVIDLYYKHEDHFLTAYFGSIPRKNLINYPLVFLTDTLLYYRPNIEGSYTRVTWKNGYQDAWLDWTGRTTNTRKESFMAGISGRVEYKKLYFENYIYMYHLAHFINPQPGDHIRDNGGAAFYLGLDLKSTFQLDKFNFNIGHITSYNRERPNPIYYANGWMFRLNTLYKIIGFNGLMYKGDKQILANGERYYTSGNYTRLDLIVIPFKARKVKAEFYLGYHILPDEVDWSQQMFVTVDFR